MDPRILIHVGRPDAELPHKSFIRVEKLFTKHPTVMFSCILWDEKDVEEVKEAVGKFVRPEGHPGFEIIHWKDDPSLLDYLGKNLQRYIGAKIVSPGWYLCEKGHVTDRNPDKLVEKCAEEGCLAKVAYKTDFDERFKQFTEVFIRITQLMNFDTRSGESLNTMVSPTANVLWNMPYAIPVEETRAVAMEHVHKSATGKPAYAVSAGPSLEDAIPHLKRLQGTGPIIAVARAFKMLKSHGITPDYIMSCEMFDWDSVIFDGVTREMAGETILTYPPVCAPRTVRVWPGRRMCLWDVNTADLLGLKLAMMGGNSVSHHILNFAAEILGAEPIILIGNDLAYTKPKTHAEGTYHEFPEGPKKQDVDYQVEAWDVCTGKGAEFHPDCHKMEGGNARPVGPIMVRTSPSYMNFRDLMEILISRHGKRVYNACPNGLKISNAPYLDLSTFDPSAPGASL